MVPGTHKPIITPEQAHLVERAAHRRYRPGRYGRTGRVYPLARLAFCGCGLRMRAETRVCRVGRAGPTTSAPVGAGRELARLRHLPGEELSSQRAKESSRR